MAEANWVEIGDIDKLREPGLRVVEVGKRKFALSFKDGQFGLITNVCNHAGATLGLVRSIICWSVVAGAIFWCSCGRVHDAGSTSPTCFEGQPAEPQPAEPSLGQLIESLGTADIEYPQQRRSLCGIKFILPPLAPLDSDEGVPDLQPDSASLRRIIGTGADAIPALLEHLDDVRPLKSQPKSALSAPGVRPVYLRLSTSFEDDSLQRQSALISKARAALKSSPADGYVMAVCDLCYFAIGQIVNRAYLPMQYIGTFQIAIVSPKVFPEIVDELRSQWGDLTVPRHFEVLKQDLAQSGVLSKRANAYARMATFYPEALSGAVCAAIDEEDRQEAPGYFISDLDYDDDEQVSECITERIVSLTRSALIDQRVTAGLACVDQLMRRKFGLSDAKKFLQAASERYPDSKPISERLAAFPQ